MNPLPDSIKQMIEREAKEFSVNPFNPYEHKNQDKQIAYTEGRMKGVEDAIEFAEWVNINFQRLGTEGFTADKWIGRSLKYRGDVHTTTELLTIFYQQKEKA